MVQDPARQRLQLLTLYIAYYCLHKTVIKRPAELALRAG